MAMLLVIYLVTILIMYLAMLATYRPQAAYHHGMLFAVMLPPYAMDDPSVREVQARFKTQFRQVTFGSLIALLPLGLLYAQMAYQTIYFLVWLTVFVIVIVIPFRRAFQATLALKREREWFVGAKRVIHSDLRVAQLKNKRSAPLWLFILPFAMSIGYIGWTASDSARSLVLPVTSLAITTLFFLVSFGMRKVKGKVYSANSEVNLSLNQAKRRMWSYGWLFMAILENIHFLLIDCLLMQESTVWKSEWFVISLLFTAIPLGIMLAVHYRVRMLEQEVLAHDGKIIYSDDDEYWGNGFTYHNPNDRSVFVTKRVGIGFTVNSATPVGKLLVSGSMIVFAAVIVGVSFLLIRSELTSPVLSVTSEHNVHIDYPMYSYDFKIGDIEELQLVDVIPKGTKTNGEATNQYARGNFRLKDIGRSKLYVVKNNPPYIQIKLKDLYVFYNEKDALQTKSLYAQLQSQVQAK
ncbi:DUF5808 domain-containing protein [Paenibacillus guangzhouensis]|uniref:DUF5808 domain-containing protein n=1 Tax=Paenibacillus guangzhouensis TaxID=1473112 RepID=UPI001D12983F|nr:DUF5808 domain-containing protein [Paenibacillus guangzhouensis]